MVDDRAFVEEIHRLRDQLAAPPSWQDPALCFVPGALPPLPEIRDESLRRQVFLHRTAVALRTEDDGAPTTSYQRLVRSYERLEGLGDRIISSQAYVVLHRTFAGAPPSSLGDISARLTCNHTISFLSMAYAADLFEAYVGALYESATLPDAVNVEDWLAKLFDKSVWSKRVAGLVDDAIARFKKTVDPKSGEATRGLWSCTECESPTGDPLQLTLVHGPFNQRIGWHAAMYLGEDKVSCGRGPTKRDAEADARDRLYKRLGL